MAEETKRPDNWLGNTPWRPDPAPLHIVLDVTEAAAAARGGGWMPDVPAEVRYATFDPERAEQVRKDWEAAGHEVFVQTIEGGLDAVQGPY